MCEMVAAVAVTCIVDLTEKENRWREKTGVSVCRQRCDIDSIEQEDFRWMNDDSNRRRLRTDQQ